MTGAGAFTNRKVISEQKHSSVGRFLFQNLPHKLVLKTSAYDSNGGAWKYSVGWDMGGAEGE